jgi:tRNA dimethylallyltransferase
MECCKLRSVGLYNGKVCLAEWGDKEGEPSSFQVLAECTELVYVRLRTLEAVASFRFLERALAVMAHYDMPVFAMASSAGNFSVVTGADASALQNVCKELSVFAEVTVEKEVEVICVQETAESKGEMRGVPHYLIDVLDPSEEFHVVKFVELAHEAMEKIYAAGQIPIVTGGTGFYIQALLKEVDFTESHGELSIRKQLEEKAATEEGAAELYRELSEVDPASAETIHPNNVKRVIRALEYYHETGQKISEHNEEQKQKESPYCSAYFVLNDERSILYDRIDRRVDQMILDGLVDEVFRLKEMGYTRDLVSMQGLGYKELFPYLAGECTLEEAVYIIKRDTRHFAKRQLTWFRREKDVIWLNKPDFDYDEEKILSYMLDRWNEIVSADAKEEGEQSC